jgi:hypothetical protein
VPRPVAVVIQTLPVVDYDRALYTVPDAEFARICAILARDPLYGQMQPDGRREMVYRSLRVSYICVIEEGTVLVTLTGIRPPEEIPRSARITRMLRRLAPVLLKLAGLLK